METALDILTTLSSIVGVPATLALAWAAFVLVDHTKQIKQLKEDLKNTKDAYDKALEEAKEKFETELKAVITKFETKFEAAAKEQKEELRAIYNKIDAMASNVATIKGFLFKGKDNDKDEG